MVCMYVRLCMTSESRGYTECGPANVGGLTVSRWDRLLVFGGCNLAALACFVICFALFPVLSLKPRKFAIL